MNRQARILPESRNPFGQLTTCPRDEGMPLTPLSALRYLLQYKT